MFVFIKLQCLLQCVFNKCPKFIQGNKRPMATHKLGDIVLNHPPFCFQTSCMPICTCWRLILCCNVVAPYPKMFSIFVHYQSQVLAKHEDTTCKINHLLHQGSFSSFLTLYSLFQKSQCLLHAMCKDSSMKFGDVISFSC